MRTLPAVVGAQRRQRAVQDDRRGQLLAAGEHVADLRDAQPFGAQHGVRLEHLDPEALGRRGPDPAQQQGMPVALDVAAVRRSCPTAASVDDLAELLGERVVLELVEPDAQELLPGPVAEAVRQPGDALGRAAACGARSSTMPCSRVMMPRAVPVDAARGRRSSERSRGRSASAHSAACAGQLVALDRDDLLPHRRAQLLEPLLRRVLGELVRGRAHPAVARVGGVLRLAKRRVQAAVLRAARCRRRRRRRPRRCRSPGAPSTRRAARSPTPNSSRIEGALPPRPGVPAALPTCARPRTPRARRRRSAPGRARCRAASPRSAPVCSGSASSSARRVETSPMASVRSSSRPSTTRRARASAAARAEASEPSGVSSSSAAAAADGFVEGLDGRAGRRFGRFGLLQLGPQVAADLDLRVRLGRRQVGPAQRVDRFRGRRAVGGAAPRPAPRRARHGAVVAVRRCPSAVRCSSPACSRSRAALPAASAACRSARSATSVARSTLFGPLRDPGAAGPQLAEPARPLLGLAPRPHASSGTRSRSAAVFSLNRANSASACASAVRAVSRAVRAAWACSASVATAPGG